MATATDLATQDWTRPSRGWTPRLGWYSWAVDAASGSRFEVDERFSLYSARTTVEAFSRPIVLGDVDLTRGQSILVNGDFESGSLAPWSLSSMTRLDDYAMSGLHAACLEGVATLGQSVDVFDGELYGLRAWVAARAPSRLRVMLGQRLIAVEDVEGAGHFHELAPPGPLIDVRFVSDRTGSVDLVFHQDRADGALVIDDIELFLA